MASPIFGALSWPASVAIITLCFAGVACLGHVLVRRSFPKADFIVHNEVAGFIIAIVGVLYAVLLGFLTVVVWERFTDAETLVRQEAGVAEDVARLAHGLDRGDRLHILTGIRVYARSIVHEEWDAMRTGGSSPDAQRAVDTLFDDATSIAPSSPRVTNVQARLLERLVALNDLRTRRLAANTSSVPGILYVTLIVGAITVIGFEYLFGLANFRVQLMMTAATAILIALLLAVIVKLDYPYRGDVAVQADEWETVQHEIQAIPLR